MAGACGEEAEEVKVVVLGADAKLGAVGLGGEFGDLEGALIEGERAGMKGKSKGEFLGGGLRVADAGDGEEERWEQKLSQECPNEGFVWWCE